MGYNVERQRRTPVVNHNSHNYVHNLSSLHSTTLLCCPLKDLVRIHNKEDVSGTLKCQPDGECFFENCALHCLCRHEELEDLSLRQFIEWHTTACVTKKNADKVLPFIGDTGHCVHPSCVKRGSRKGQCAQGAIEQENPAFIRVSQWMFPDTATFKANLLECPSDKINTKMEECSQLVLALFFPHRHVGDLKAFSPMFTNYVRSFGWTNCENNVVRRVSFLQRKTLTFFRIYKMHDRILSGAR